MTESKRNRHKRVGEDKGLLDRIAEVDELQGKAVKCFLCGRWPDVRLSKKGRPYFVCDACGMQVFVRGNKGIERLKEKVREVL